MKNTLLHYLLVFVLFGCHFQTKAQGNLTFVGPVHYTCDFFAPYSNTNAFQRVPIDTIVVPLGHAVKLEGDNICRLGTAEVLLNGQLSSIIGAIDLKITGIAKATILSNFNYFAYGNSTKLDHYPLWLGPGVHYLHFSNNTQAQFSARYSLHGLLFQIQ
jgi:hypothetical protein